MGNPAPKLQDPLQPTQQMGSCVACHGIIEPDAPFCKHCGKNQRSPSYTLRPAFVVLLAFLLMITFGSTVMWLRARRPPTEGTRHYSRPVVPAYSGQNIANRQPLSTTAPVSREPTNDELTASLLVVARPAINDDLGKFYSDLHGDKLQSWSVTDLRTNIEKTNSLTSPYVGYVSVTTYVKITPDPMFPDIDGGTYHHTLTFGLQNGQWVETGIQ